MKLFRTINFALLICILFFISAPIVFAIPPDSPYIPGETMSPICSPGDQNCTVQAYITGMGNANQVLMMNSAGTALEYRDLPSSSGSGSGSGGGTGAVTSVNTQTGDVTLSKSDVGLGNVENMALSTWLGSSALTTLGTIMTGVWNGTAIDPDHGGTGLSSLGNDGQILKVVGGVLSWASDATDGGGGGVWGAISGTLSAQTDLVAALATKEPTIAAGTTSQYWRGDKTWQTLDKSAVGLGNVDNTSDLNKPVSTATQTALDGKQATLGFTPVASTVTVNGHPLSSNVTVTKSDLGLGNVENTALSTWPGSSALTTTGTITSGTWNAGVIGDAYIASAATWNAKQNALGFTPVANTVTVNGHALSSNVSVTKADVGLSNADNTSDTSKPISTATQTALDAKQATITTGTTAQYFRGDLSLATFPTNLPTQTASGTITRAAATASGTQTITLPFNPAYVVFSAIDDGDSSTFSDGWDDGTTAISTRSYSLTLLATLISSSVKSHTTSINVQTSLLSGNGHSALITSKSGTGFTLTWTKIGSGRAITVKYLAVY